MKLSNLTTDDVETGKIQAVITPLQSHPNTSRLCLAVTDEDAEPKHYNLELNGSDRARPIADAAAHMPQPAHIRGDVVFPRGEDTQVGRIRAFDGSAVDPTADNSGDLEMHREGREGSYYATSADAGQSGYRHRAFGAHFDGRFAQATLRRVEKSQRVKSLFEQVKAQPEGPARREKEQELKAAKSELRDAEDELIDLLLFLAATHPRSVQVNLGHVNEEFIEDVPLPNVEGGGELGFDPAMGGPQTGKVVFFEQQVKRRLQGDSLKTEENARSAEESSDDRLSEPLHEDSGPDLGQPERHGPSGEDQPETNGPEAGEEEESSEAEQEAEQEAQPEEAGEPDYNEPRERPVPNPGGEPVAGGGGEPTPPSGQQPPIGDGQPRGEEPGYREKLGLSEDEEAEPEPDKTSKIGQKKAARLEAQLNQ